MRKKKKKWWKKFLPASEGILCLLTMVVVVVTLVRTQPAEPPIAEGSRGSAMTNVITDRSTLPPLPQDEPARVRVVSHTSVK